MIEAAGGVVWRANKGSVEVLIVHRPRYDDWSLPKGKLKPGERAIDCAVREVREETGRRCVAGPELAPAEYLDRKGRGKRVRYWAMQPHGGHFRANAEVDRVIWLVIGVVPGCLTYPHDLPVVASLLNAMAPSN